MAEQERAFRELLIALKPWLKEIVIIGGRAHELYRQHAIAQELLYPPLITLDTDVAIPSELPIRDEDMRQRLLNHGFVEELVGDAQPPATHYRLGTEASGFYAEFLTPLTGGRYDRRGKLKATIQISGISSQRLRYIDLLLIRPWSVAFASADFRARVQIPNPVCFLAQKILIHNERPVARQAKDILYIHDTIEIFGSHLEELRKLWKDEVAATLTKRAGASVSKAHERLFGSVSDEVRQAAQIARDRRISAERVRETSAFGLSVIFGP